MSSFLAIALFWFVPIGLGWHLGKTRGRRGWLWGLLLGWIGVLFVWRLPDNSKTPAERLALKDERSWEKALAKAQRNLEQANAKKVLAAYHKSVILYEDELATPHGRCALSADINASVETEGSLQKYVTSRVTLTRAATIGIFALGAKKKKTHTVDTRELYLAIETPEFSSIVTCKPAHSQQVRNLAVAIMNAGKRADALLQERTERIAQAETELRDVELARPSATPRTLEA